MTRGYKMWGCGHELQIEAAKKREDNLERAKSVIIQADPSLPSPSAVRQLLPVT